MKKVFKISALALVCMAAIAIAACNPCDSSSVPGYMDIKGFAPKNSNLTTLSNLNANDSILWSKFGINFHFEVSFVADNSMPHYDFSLFNRAYAKCTLPDPGNLGSKEKITNMHIITLLDYDSTHVANDTIDDLFMIKNELREVDIPDFITIQGKIYGANTNYFEPTRQPTTARNAQFKIVMDLDSGEHYEGTTEVIKLTL